MIEKIGYIRNPLTVIAIFAAIAEISGTTVLPFLEPDNQSIYIWFLMLFPAVLVAFFFLTLNFNHVVLYAPSDYQDERHFVDPFTKAPPEVQDKKLREEAEEVEAESPSEPEAGEPEQQGPEAQAEREAKTVTPVSAKIKGSEIAGAVRSVMADVALAEKLAVNKLARQLGVTFKTDAQFLLPDSTKVVFDAAGMSESAVHAVEVKLFKDVPIALSRLDRTLRNAVLASRAILAAGRKEFVFHLIIVSEADEDQRVRLRKKLEDHVSKYSINANIYVSSFSDLQNESRYGL